MRFAHMADCHLGGWRYPELQQLNLESFQKAVDICIKEKVDFILIAGDLFDSAYPPIEILKSAFHEFKKIKESGIPVYIIAGSHDYSVSGKTFLDVLETAGFCKNVFKFEEKEKKIMLLPTIERNTAIYGYPGKKSGLEVQELKNIRFQDAPGMFKIFALHTTLTAAKGTLPIDSVSVEELPRADYYALGHLHIDFCHKGCVYSGPIFPNNFEELEKLKFGTFYIVDPTSGIKKIELKLKEVLVLDLEITDAFRATEKIVSELEKTQVADKIIMLRLHGTLEQGKTSDISFVQIENYLKDKKAFFFMKNISQLKTEEVEIKMEVSGVDKMEEQIIQQHKQESTSKFNSIVDSLISSLQLEKQEDEKSQTFESRLIAELKKVVNI